MVNFTKSAYFTGVNSFTGRSEPIRLSSLWPCGFLVFHSRKQAHPTVKLVKCPLNPLHEMREELLKRHLESECENRVLVEREIFQAPDSDGRLKT
jgi:hypothetical protein